MTFLHEWLPIVISVFALMFTGMNFVRASRKDTGSIAMERATMIADLRYIREAVEDMKVDSKVLREDLRSMDIRLTAVEASVSSAHKRLDAVMKTIREEV